MKSTKIIQDKLSENNFGAVVEPMVLSTTFLRDDTGNFIENRDIYARASNPNRKLLESKLALLENGQEAACFASGQAATMAIFQSLPAGCHIILPNDIYYGTKSLFEQLFANNGFSFSVVDYDNLKAIEQSINASTRLIWIETPSNPQLKITDIAEVVKIAQKHNIITVCDNTWATPFFTNPFDFEVDLVMHSTTKYIGGHSDLIGGVLIGQKGIGLDWMQKIRQIQHLGGAIPSSFDCWLMLRSLSTFHVRMPVHASNALKLAQFLANHPSIEAVYYPGLPQNNYHQIALKQMKNGFGGMLSILIKGDAKNCLAVASKLKVFKHATSLGGVESLVDHRKTAEGPASVSPENLLRVSVGIEDITDLIADFNQALT